MDNFVKEKNNWAKSEKDYRKFGTLAKKYREGVIGEVEFKEKAGDLFDETFPIFKKRVLQI